MQISEFRDLLANDGFAATFQTMGQYRTELLRALDGFRAQADARSIYQLRRADGAWIDQTEQSYKNNQQHCAIDTRIVYTHPEASAPGLSDDEIESIARECEPTVTGMHPEAVVEIVRACLTRASAATACVACEGSPSAENNPCAVCGSAATTSSDANARIEELRKGLFEARDAMSVMSNWVKQSDPAGHSWGVRMVDRANTVLSGASAATVGEASEKVRGLARAVLAKRGSDNRTDEQQAEAFADFVCHEESEAAQQQAEPPAVQFALLEMESCIEDPMWANHAEVSKSIIRGWHAMLSAAQQQADRQARIDAIYTPEHCEEIERRMQQAEPGADERESLRDKWKIVDGDCREGANGLITHHVTAFDEGWQARAAQSGQRAGVAEGWRFYSADFSITAHQPSQPGYVMLIRDEIGYKKWHGMDEAAKEEIPLFITGRGVTFEKALLHANENALAAAPTQQQEGGDV